MTTASGLRLTRRGKAVLIGAVVGLFVALMSAVMPPMPTAASGTGPYYYCTIADDTAQWLCYPVGEVPSGVEIVWSGYSSNMPR